MISYRDSDGALCFATRVDRDRRCATRAAFPDFGLASQAGALCGTGGAPPGKGFSVEADAPPVHRLCQQAKASGDGFKRDLFYFRFNFWEVQYIVAVLRGLCGLFRACESPDHATAFRHQGRGIIRPLLDVEAHDSTPFRCLRTYGFMPDVECVMIV